MQALFDHNEGMVKVANTAVEGAGSKTGAKFASLLKPTPEHYMKKLKTSNKDVLQNSLLQTK